jgi:predicted AAA+ superfamily ATPase
MVCFCVVIDRPRHLRALATMFRRSPVVAILGARQVGKTTLAMQYARGRSQRPTHFDLENPAAVARLAEPIAALESLRGLVILDEIHHRPDLFPALRVLVDRPRSTTRFLVLGSASPALLRQSSESLAGRIAYHLLDGFALDEIGVRSTDRLWLRGGYPRSLLARSESESDAWRNDLVRTYVERDLPDLGVTIPSVTLRRFWTMLAHWQGQVWNSAEFARAFGVADTTVRRYLDLLAGTFMVRVLQPFHENIAKRQVKSPKVYLADSGLLHTLLGIRTLDDLETNPRVGASWEGFAIEQVAARLGARADECFFWATHTGAELDLLVVRGRKRYGFEMKRSTEPRVTPSMRHALEDLKLDRLDVIHAGRETYPLARHVRAVALTRILRDLKPLA